VQLDSRLIEKPYRHNKGNLGAIILAGGKSSRMQSNKVFLKIKGEPLVKHVVRVTSRISNHIILAIGKHDREENYASILPKSVKITRDKTEKKAALYGMITGLETIETDYAVILAVDTPFININVIKQLQIEAQGFDVAIPVWPNGNIEPLYAVYNVATTIWAFKKAVEEGENRIKDVINKLKHINYVPVEKFKDLDANLNCFFNINTPKDFKTAEQILSRKH
jgi:molybdopterin-guanine dinucleotide biosynthesis protein A|tara:strand:+ start:455 stop:1123 length:669 start_codon:yes stop_codon:yes gene_type:complete